MQAEHLRRCLDSEQEARQLFAVWNVHDIDRGKSNLTRLASHLGMGSLVDLAHPLGRLLPRCADPDMAINNLERFFANPAGVSQTHALLESRARTLETLLQVFSVSQFFSDLLISNPDYLEMLRIPLRSSPSKAELIEILQQDVESAFEDSAVLRAFRKFRQRQMLRIGANDIIRDRPLEEITKDISQVADASLEVALWQAHRNLKKRFGEPTTADQQPARCVILAFGKLGGKELNYSSDIDLMFVYDEEGSTRGPRTTSIGNDDFFSRVCSEVVRLVTAHTDRGQAYRVDLRLRPEGNRGPLARSLASTLSYYDTLGRTWERQALVKIRPVAGNAKLGEEFLQSIEPFVYRKYLTVAEINEIKALKRKIEHRTARAGESQSDVKTGMGGIRDVEFTIQFLQLLNGGDLPDVRQSNTLKALAALEKVGCVTDQEYRVLDDTYRFLRKLEHRLQLMFDLQTHRMPEASDELRKLAVRMGYVPDDSADATVSTNDSRLLDRFLGDYREKTTLNRKILDHLLHSTFTGQDGPDPESDLLLDPSPSPERIQEVLGKYPFKDPQSAYQNLTLLATETVPFLSTRRCRQFLANIAPRLLRAISETPDPDLALVNLEKVSASLGGKGVLWELFSFNQPSLKLYIELCAWSQFLSEILINNPGMIDELLDSLVLNQRRTAEELRHELADLCKNADDANPILHSFNDKELLRIGVRDILGKDTVQNTTRALSDLAETVLRQIDSLEYPKLVRKLGAPQVGDGQAANAGKVSRYVLLGLGKLGGQEMSYHSDLDLILVYEGDGRTVPPQGSSRWDTFELTDNFHFFSELARHIIRTTSDMGAQGRLYKIDMRLRPTGQSGSLVIPLREFIRYYDEGEGQLWERQALTRARVVAGDPDFANDVLQAVARETYQIEWRNDMVDEIRSMRDRILASGSKRDLKRCPGGTVDVEFLVQMFRLKYGRRNPEVRHPNTWNAIDALRAVGLVSDEEHAALYQGYTFLRHVQCRLRIFQNRSLDELPDAADELEKLARRIGVEHPADQPALPRFLEEFEKHTGRVRNLFGQLFDREKERTEPA
jgi:glutamate-ammonia-ligase adenylyltransferase